MPSQALHMLWTCGIHELKQHQQQWNSFVIPKIMQILITRHKIYSQDWCGWCWTIKH